MVASLGKASFVPPIAPSADGFVEKTKCADKKIKDIVDDNFSPVRKYKVIQDENSKAKVNFSPEGKKTSGVIYRFKDKKGRCYIGKTERTAGKRASEHMSSVNTSKDRGKAPLYEAIRKGPKEFDFGILYHIKEGEDIDIDALEREYISRKGAHVTGFNQNAGGGGGHAVKAKLSPKEIDGIVKKTLAKFSSPEKRGSIKKKGSGFATVLSPRSAKTKNVIYVFLNTLTGERYVGKTMQALKSRMYGHMSNAKCEDKDRGKSPLAEAIREDYKHIKVGILYEAPIGSEDVLSRMEQAFIKHYSSAKSGYNQNEGGGGGSSK